MKCGAVSCDIEVGIARVERGDGDAEVKEVADTFGVAVAGEFGEDGSCVGVQVVQDIDGAALDGGLIVPGAGGEEALEWVVPGDDESGGFQQEEMDREGVDAHWIMAPGCMSQSSFILIDEKSGERTVLWKRDLRIALHPEDLRADWIAGARVLLIDGHDTAASTQAAQWAREAGTLVLGDFDNRYHGVEELLEYVDFAITSKDFPARPMGEHNLLKSLPKIHAQFKCCLTGATLGRLGALLWNGVRFHLCPGFRVRTVDTTGAGDIFHGAFAYGIVRGWPVDEILEFSCAAGGLNCEGHGARGGIATLLEIDRLRRRGERSERAYSNEELAEASRAAVSANLGMEV